MDSIFVSSATISERAQSFVHSMLERNPALAAFDCDGTLWSGDAGEGFFRWEIARGMIANDVARLAQEHYAEYHLGNVSEDDMCGEMVTIHRGLRESEILGAAAEYFEANIAPEI